MIDEEEIAGKIAQAEDKPEEIAILALKNGVNKSELRTIAIEQGVLKAWSDTKVKELYDQGYTDKQLSNAFGFTKSVIGQWRARNKLPPHKTGPKVTHQRRPKSKIDDAKARELYNAGKNDGEIAKVVGVTTHGICDWRKRNGLPANRQVHKKPETVSKPPETVSKPTEPNKLPQCHCCGMEIPKGHCGIKISALVTIGGVDYKLCPQCALAVEWATEKLEAKENAST